MNDNMILLENFVQYLCDNEKSDKTIEAYNSDIKQFLDYNKN